MTKTIRIACLFALATLTCCTAAFAKSESITVTHLEAEGKVRVEIGGELFTELIYKGRNKPVLYPVIGPHGIGMTRNWPLSDATAGEQTDHYHHESIWFTHGNVNGVDFWSHRGEKTPQIIQTELVRADVQNNRAEIVANHQWVAPGGKVICTDRQTIGLSVTPTGRVIDYAVTLIASEGDVTLGDTKEGTMGIRTHPVLRVSGKVAKGKARNSAGDKDKALWGKHAKWVDYYGPIDGETVGIAIFDHPSNPRHPTTWHARDYGLVTANPFGLHHFQKQPNGAGNMTIEAGDEVTFRYRFLFHEGDTESAAIGDQYDAWAQPRPAKAETSQACDEQHPHRVVYEGDEGPGKGQHIVFIAGDHEYRGEETLPALARILAKNYGFRCSVFFTTDPKTGFIQPGSSHISGLDALETADLMVVFLRFQDFPDEEMRHVVDYLQRGGPVLGLRTSTHAFKIKGGKTFAKFSTGGTADYKGGFGRQILGETWVGHYGRNHKQSSRLLLQEEAADHPILRGVRDVHVQCGGYKAFPIEGSKVLALGQVLDGMTIDSPAAKDKEQMAVAWVRQYRNEAGEAGRVFTTTHGASEDILNDGFRRMLINAHFWCMGMDDSIKPDIEIGFVGPYQPVTYSFGGHVKGVKPADLADWDSPILPKPQSDNP